MAQQVQRDAMGPHLEGESDGPPHGEIHSALDQEFHQKYYVTAKNKIFAILAKLAWKIETLTPE